MDEKEKNEKLKKISSELLQINGSLEKILHASLGMDDEPEWLIVLDKLEKSFVLAFDLVAKTKGMQTQKIIDNEEVERVLGEIMGKDEIVDISNMKIVIDEEKIKAFLKTRGVEIKIPGIEGIIEGIEVYEEKADIVRKRFIEDLRRSCDE